MLLSLVASLPPIGTCGSVICDFSIDTCITPGTYCVRNIYPSLACGAYLSCVPNDQHVTTVIEVNNDHLKAIAKHGISPPLAARNLAIFHQALSLGYENQNQAKTTCSGRPEIVGIIFESVRNHVLKALYNDVPINYSMPSQEPCVRDAIRFGKSASKKILNERLNDHAYDPVSYTVLNEEDSWKPTAPGYSAKPLLPGWGSVPPFGSTNTDYYISPTGPKKPSSNDFQKELEEVYRLGGIDSAVRTEDESEIAIFWAPSPPPMFNVAAHVLLQNDNANVQKTLDVLKYLNMAVANAGIAGWQNKYKYNSWRPSTALLANTIINDKNWKPLLEDPVFPEFVSGHSIFGAAATTILEHYGLGDKPFSFTFGGMHRSFDSISVANWENGRSRIFGGVHFETGDVEGQRIGVLCANDIIRQIPQQ